MYRERKRAPYLQYVRAFKNGHSDSIGPLPLPIDAVAETWPLPKSNESVSNQISYTKQKTEQDFQVPNGWLIISGSNIMEWKAKSGIKYTPHIESSSRYIIRDNNGDKLNLSISAMIRSAQNYDGVYILTDQSNLYLLQFANGNMQKVAKTCG